MAGQGAVVAQLPEVVVTDREQSPLLGVFLTAEDVRGASSKGDVDDIKFLLHEVVEFAEVGEEATEGTDLGSEAKLAKLILTLHQDLVLVSDQS